MCRKRSVSSMPVPNIDEVCRRAVALPCSPRLLPNLVAALQAETTSAERLETLIMRDPPIAASTLRLANSAYFFNGEPVGSVSEAVFRLGFREVYKLAVGTLASRWLSLPIDGYGWDPAEACRRALIVAAGAEILATGSAGVDKEIAFTAGLTHELGRLAIAFSCAESHDAVMAARAARGSSLEAAESEILGYNHAIVGARIMEMWNFPGELTATARFSGTPADAPSRLLPVVMHVHAARKFSGLIGLCSDDPGSDFIPDEALLGEFGFTGERFEALQPELLEMATRLLREQFACGSVE